MGETFTSIFNAVTNKAQVKQSEVVQENLDVDDVMFYHSIRADLDLLKKKPKLQTIHYILDYSKSRR
ncbi:MULTISPECIES: hypothetical protein [Mucilaginibacter]|uniref:hypothetical protein n=1 Tax=Mucilaginibacter TaxID=423349 RepID=UPI0020904AA7|nr:MULTISPECIES: hypothetical protein [Mucilaginibacter]MCO5935723.1 hypothetical protein [Mucilaginibacter aurantiaciroseus]MEB0261209.1 hypothetical protein [Mucilaginibacter sp. 10I4]MEB0280382.1 hypothetical protein [Mucilaginibacter sp. 10B2]MEB0300403.1 hypothetical protein [Mucilaginibacter sp. 5C4]WPX24528.1 hypothetical protein RHM67_04480 [Mucilaginibacter sp. 5C4]